MNRAPVIAPRSGRRRALIAAVATVLVAATVVVPVTVAAAHVSACGSPPLQVVDGGGAASAGIAYQSNSGLLWTADAQSAGNAGLGMMAETSPAITVLAGGGFQMAFQANTGSLWTVGVAGCVDWRLGMRAGTSPSIAALAGGGFQVAFQANSGSLWTVGTAGIHDWGLGMMPGTSPSITGLMGGGFQVAFQANSGSLWTVGTAGMVDWRLGMMADTSPSIAGLASSGFQVAFQANSGLLWTAGSWGVANWLLGMRPETSPSVTGLPGGGFQIAFQANTGGLWTAGSYGTTNWGLGMMARTNPGIAGLPGGGFQVAFQANSRSLWTAGTAGVRNWNSALRADSSPAIAAGGSGGRSATGGKPNASNTGVPAGTPLSRYTGPLVITTDGTVIDRKEIYGDLRIQARNVVIRNSRLRCGSEIPPNGNSGCIDANSFAVYDLLIEDNTIIPDHPSYYRDGIVGHEFTARGNHISRSNDGIGIFNRPGGSAAANVTVDGNYIHDLTHWNGDPAHSDGTHDGIEIQGGENIVVRNNNVEGTVVAGDGLGVFGNYAGAALIVVQNVAKIRNLVIEDNWFDGGQNSVCIQHSKYADVELTLRNNLFGRDQYTYARDSTYQIRIYSKSRSNVQGLFTNRWEDTGGYLAEGRDLGIRYNEP